MGQIGMLVKIGPSIQSDNVVDLLVACHERIRNFTALARSAGQRPDAPERDVVDACLRLERYFTEALPLHVRDEEDSVFPRLYGLSPEVDRALRDMKEQHAGHEEVLGALLRASSEVRRNPSAAEVRAELVLVAERLERAFAEHLALEETIVFPAIRTLLSPAAQMEIREELRRRRDAKKQP